MYVCMYVCVNVCLHVCVYVCMHVCKYLSMYVQISNDACVSACFSHMEGQVHTYNHDLFLANNTSYTQACYFIVLLFFVYCCMGVTHMVHSLNTTPSAVQNYATFLN